MRFFKEMAQGFVISVIVFFIGVPIIGVTWHINWWFGVLCCFAMSYLTYSLDKKYNLSFEKPERVLGMLLAVALFAGALKLLYF